MSGRDEAIMNDGGRHDGDWQATIVDGAAAALALLDHAPDAVVATPFQHPDWLAAWAATFGAAPGARLFAVEVRDGRDGRIVARLPLSLEVFSSVRILRFWDRGASDYNAALLASDVAADPVALAAIWRRLVAVLPPCDLVVFDKLPRDLGGFADPRHGIGTLAPSLNAGHVVHLGPDWAIDGTLGRSLARKRRKLANKGELVFRLTAAADDPGALETLLAQRRVRFAEANRDRDPAEVEAFWRRLAATSPIARLATLRLDGKLLAAGFGTRTGQSFQLLATGFDPAWKNWSPGLVMIEDLIAATRADGVTLFDFTVGDETYKAGFAPEDRPLADLFVAFTLKGRLAGWWRRRVVARRRATAGRAVG